MACSSPLPIVAAPMAGGASTPALAAAVCAAGGVGSLALGYLTPDAAADLLARRPDGPLVVNLFLPDAPSPGVAEPYVARLRAAGLDVDDPRWDDDAYPAKLDLACEARPAAVSFTFGCPEPEAVRRVRAAGSEVWVTVTSVAEARRAAAAGADVLVVQGAEAGGHRGAFADDPGDVPVGLLALLQRVRAAVDTRLVAAGGIATAGGVAAVLALGASRAAAGTAFLLAPEAGTSPPHRAVVGTDAPTAFSRAYTGRLARGVVNGFMRAWEGPVAYPEVHHATARMRARARDAGDPDRMHLWAGQAHALTVARPAAETVAALAPG